MADVTDPTPKASTSSEWHHHREQIGLDRLNAFSDGVYAIAITLLVLELSVPEGPTGIFPALAEEWQELLVCGVTGDRLKPFSKRGSHAGYQLGSSSAVPVRANRSGRVQSRDNNSPGTRHI